MITPSLWALMTLWRGWKQRMVTFQLSLSTLHWLVGERSHSLMVEFGTPGLL